MSEKLQLGVLASGGGTNLQAILDRCADGRLSAEVKVVISNEPDAYALERARKMGVLAILLNHRDYPNRESHDRAILDTLKGHNVELIVLAGYMRIFSSFFFQAFVNRIINIHPALLPSFGGKGMFGIHVHEAALAHGVKVSGLTVHFVEEAVDAGPIILQHAVPVMENDTPESLQQRILKFENEKYAEAIQLIAEGRVKIEGRRAKITQ